MMADMAVELKKHNVAAISLWPGAVLTELVKDIRDGKYGERAEKTVCHACVLPVAIIRLFSTSDLP